MSCATFDDHGGGAGIHPGVVLAEDFLEPLGLSPHSLSIETGLDEDFLTDIIEGRRDLDRDTALRLAAFFRVGSEFWMDLQQGYETAPGVRR